MRDIIKLLGCVFMKVRIISAIVMIAIALPILILGGMPFKIFAIILGCCSLYELFKVRKEDKDVPILLKVFSYIALIILIYFGNTNVMQYIIDYKVITLIFAIYFLPIVFINDNSKYNINDALFILGGTIFLGVVFNLFCIIRNTELTYFIYLLLITIFTDTFALVSGMLIGQHKLCEKISPNKTIEGFVFGSLLGTIIASTFYLTVINPSANLIYVTLITLLLSIVGQIGDLFFSSIKRNYKVKDFSNLIPGHGGILDRLDSFVFVVITYMLFINIL